MASYGPGSFNRPRNTVQPVSYSPRERSIGDKDYIQYIIDQCELSDWDKQFTSSCMDWLRKHEDNSLSLKQGNIMNKYYEQFELADDIGKGFLYAGYYNDVVSGVPAKKTTPTESMSDIDDIDMGGDIPF